MSCRKWVKETEIETMNIFNPFKKFGSRARERERECKDGAGMGGWKMGHS